MQIGMKTMIFFWKITFRLQHDCNENKNNMYWKQGYLYVCIGLFVFPCSRYWLNKKHTTPYVIDGAIQKGLSEHISTRCVLKQTELQISKRIPRVS